MDEYVSERVALERLPSGMEIATTVHTYGRGEPTVYVQAVQHGREISGVEVLRRFHERIDPAALDGRVIAVPVANPLTFDRGSYTTPGALDSVNPNMNRTWPGDPDGSLHQRMAARLWEFAGEADAIVDLHAASPAVLPHVVFTEGDRQSRELAEVFGTELLLAEPAEASAEWRDRKFDSKLRVAAARNGIPAITPELGRNRQLVEDEIRTGVEGLFSTLRELDVLDGTTDRSSAPVARNHLGRVTADHSGLFRVTADVALGDRVQAGTELGAIVDPTTYRTLETVEVDRDGILYLLTREATVVAGDRLASVAIELE